MTRMTQALTVAAFAVLLTACVGTPDEGDLNSQPAKAAAPVQTELASNSADRRVCKRERETGTRVSRKVCRSQSEWERLRRESLESVERSRTGADTVTGGND